MTRAPKWSLLLSIAAPLAWSVPAAAQQPATDPAPAPTGTGEATPPAEAPIPSEPAKPRRAGPGFSLSPDAPQAGGRVTSPAEPPPVVATEPSAEWKFEVTGYFRAPMRMSWGPSTTADLNNQNAGDPGTQFRTPPLIPDANYIDWRYTNSFVAPWTELNFRYGNDRVKAQVQIASYNLTDSGYRRLESNLGINQAFISITWPELANVQNLHLNLIVGGFTNRYGAAGRYDAGKYETYLFGRTHVAGLTTNIGYDVGENLTLQLEGGFGGKLEPIPFYGEPQGRGAGSPLQQLAIWEPYPGPRAQESTFVAHGHAGALLWKQLMLSAHYLHIFANDNERSTAFIEGTFISAEGGRSSGEDAPRIRIYGADAKLLGGVLGDGYLGFSRLDARNAIYLADGIEVLHSFGGWQLSDNYFNTPGSAALPVTGSVSTLLGQYSFSWGQFFHYPKAFWGQGPDLITTVFGMMNWLNTMNPATDGLTKVKFGGEVTYLPLGWFGLGGRFDVVRPDWNDSDTAFSVISPRLIFRTDFVTHEQILIQYSRYFTGDNVRGMFPYNMQTGAGQLQGTDKNAVQIAAIIWF